MRQVGCEIVVDSFAGGGGASAGIELAIGRPVDVAINHNAAAILMHAANHPRTRHFTEDVFRVSPRKATGGRPVGLLWASPDCRHFSRAKGGKPVEKSIRGLAWVVVKWATEVQPRVIVLENVREFQDWGPLLPRWDCPACKWKGTEGQAVLVRKKRACPRCDSRKLTETANLIPDPARKGLTFKQFVGRLKARGYVVEWRVLNAADFGAPTHRRRLFLIARCDGEPIQWPEATHGDPKKIAASVGDLFPNDLKPWRTAAECIDWSIPCPSIFDRKRPLKEKTLRRIALGVKRYVLDNPKPFIVDMQRGNRPRSTGEPMGTVTTQDNRFNVVTPIISPLTHHGDRRPHGADEPLPTITGANRGEQAIIAPVIATLAHGEKGRWGHGSADVEQPLGTVHAGGKNHALVSAFLAKHFGGVVGVAANTPLPTTTARGTQTQVVAANLVHLNNNTLPADPEQPLHTVTSGGSHAALVYSFLTKYFGSGGQWQTPADPLHTVTGKARFGLVTVSIEGEPYVIVDIGMRMLTPRELARAQGFPDSYVLTGTKTNQVERIGNSVCPPMAEAIVAANYIPDAVAAVA